MWCVCVCEWLSCKMRAKEWTNPCILCTVCTRCNRISLYVGLLSFCLLMLWCFGALVLLCMRCACVFVVNFDFIWTVLFSSYARTCLPSSISISLSLYLFPSWIQTNQKYKKRFNHDSNPKKTSSFFTFILVLSLSSSSSVCNRNTHVTW